MKTTPGRAALPMPTSLAVILPPFMPHRLAGPPVGAPSAITVAEATLVLRLISASER